MVKVLYEKHEHDKNALRGEYEELITQIREEYQLQKSEMREQMKKLEYELQVRQRDLREMRADTEAKVAKQLDIIIHLEKTNIDN